MALRYIQSNVFEKTDDYLLDLLLTRRLYVYTTVFYRHHFNIALLENKLLKNIQIVQDSRIGAVLLLPRVNKCILTHRYGITIALLIRS